MNVNFDDAKSRNAFLDSLAGRYVAKGMDVNVHVAPCSWMYKHNGFQIEFRAVDGSSWGHCIDHKLAVGDATRQDIERLLGTHLEKRTCATCSRCYLFNLVEESNRGALCEGCWMKDWEKNFDKIIEKQKKAQANRDARMLRQGFTHRVSIWVHPSRGDDYEVAVYTVGAPKKSEIRKVLVKKGSRVLDDYTVAPLAKEGN